MSTCPHPAHAAPKQVVWDYLPISFCRDGCNQAFFLWANDLMANGPHAISSHPNRYLDRLFFFA